MPRAEITVRTKIPRTYRAAAVQGMFDVPAADEQVLTFTADLSAIDGKDWAVGAIVGASGRGKSTIARALWPDEYVAGAYQWGAPSILDDFPEHLTPEAITSALVATGFSSAPCWLRPYSVLSTGQRHRADLARALASGDGLVAFDEFTSTVDRTVAKAVSVAVARHVRRNNRRFIGVSCHRDVVPWLSADWCYDLDEGDGGTLAWGPFQRPRVELVVTPGDRSAWPLFRGHHYLTGELHRAARIFLGWVRLDAEWHLAGFFSLLPSAGHQGWWRGHRTVVLPDFQGLGVGNAMIESTAEELWRKERRRFRATTSARALIAHRRRHPEMWVCTNKPGMRAAVGRTSTIKGMTSSAGRLTVGWVYVPAELRHGA